MSREAVKLGFTLVNLGDFVREAASTEGIEPTASNLETLMMELRRRSGLGVMAELASKKIQSSNSSFVVVDGVRSMSEVQVFRRIASTKILAIQSAKLVRFDFLLKRRRSDAPSDEGSFDSRDRGELSVGIGETIALSDETISNSQISLEELKQIAQTVFERWKIE